MKEEKTIYGDSVVYLSLVSKEEALKIKEDVGSIHAFPILNNQILFTKNQRGIDIIGGHVEKNETYIDTLMRESLEEAYIKPISFELIGAIKVDNRENNNPKYPKIGYQLFYVIDKFELLNFEGKFESDERVFLNKDLVKDTHHKWLNIHEELLNLAINNKKDLKKTNKLKF